jgi:predicted TIM-barrel fold metal-dependent hydrolase
VAQWLGNDHLVFPTDFPHSFTFERFVEEVKGFVNRKDLPAELSRKILWDNPKRLYRIRARRRQKKMNSGLSVND